MGKEIMDIKFTGGGGSIKRTPEEVVSSELSEARRKAYLKKLQESDGVIHEIKIPRDENVRSIDKKIEPLDIETINEAIDRKRADQNRLTKQMEEYISSGKRWMGDPRYNPVTSNPVKIKEIDDEIKELMQKIAA
jgi:hypothetical protein